MFVHICYTMTYTYMMHIIIYRSNRHTNTVCCRCKSNLKNHCSIVDPLWLVTNTSLLEDSKNVSYTGQCVGSELG